jgi:L-iditol 2-dehydrogenase
LIDFRLGFAKKFGADSVINSNEEDFAEVVKVKTENRGVDVAVVAAPNIEAYKTGLSVCRKGGTLCVFAPTRPGEYLRISPKEMFFSEIQIIASYSTSHLETHMALRLIESGRVRVRELITHRYGLENVSEAFKTALEGTESLKVMILNV